MKGIRCQARPAVGFFPRVEISPFVYKWYGYYPAGYTQRRRKGDKPSPIPPSY